MVGRAALTLFASLLASWAAAAGAQTYVVRVACRDGLPTGAYELRNPDGHLRVAGAFEHGRRNGSFFFWTSAGARIAQLPFDQDVMNGTAALWYAKPDASGDGPRKLVAEYRAGRLNGTKRTWYPNGRPRTEVEYANGEIQSAVAWGESGKQWSARASRELALRDAGSDAAHIASLEEIVRSNRGACSADAERVARSADSRPPGDASRRQTSLP